MIAERKEERKEENFVDPCYNWNLQMIKDLIDPTDKVRGVGRSSILMNAYMELAFENIDIKIEVRDHFIGHAENERWFAEQLLNKINIANQNMLEKCYRTRFGLIQDKRSYFIIYSQHIGRYDTIK